ncbi:MAG: hypothetical protein ACI9EF_002751 [Pseudohongiellaceae bacterium]|jgi:hypothetical protein
MQRSLILLAVSIFSPSVAAQFDDAWIEFVRDDSMISAAAPISSATLETDLAWGDLDDDGDTDLVIVRSRPYILVGKRTNMLLMNEAGVLTDRTSTLAASSDVVGDQGFLTPTQDRDVVIADVDGDGRPDVVTAADLWQPGDTKAITHPRVYHNQGDGGGGSWLGLKHEDFRVPQIMVQGAPAHPRFMAVTAGDVDNDGDIDLYFGDQDFVAMSVFEPAGEDTHDRLLINDGSGVFSDGTFQAFAFQQVNSLFHNAVAFDDFNQDGLVDLLQEDGYFDPTAIIYNQLAMPGVFVDGVDEIYNGSGYFASTGDLNSDGRPDIVISDNGSDKFMINTGNGTGGEAEWAAPSTFDFLSGGDGGIGANNLVADLNGDGWNDVLIADMDPEIPGTNRRLQIYHNRGGTPGGTDIVLREERESTLNSDWIGVKGMNTDALRATHDVAVFDVDGDGRTELIVSQLAGTFVWRQLSVWTDLGMGLAGAGGTPSLVGSGTLAAGSSWGLSVHGAAASTPVAFIVGLAQLSLPFKGGVLVPSPDIILTGFTSGPNGWLAVGDTWPAGIPAGVSVYQQAWITDPSGPSGFAASNGVASLTP